jgi:hypothetical protein
VVVWRGGRPWLLGVVGAGASSVVTAVCGLVGCAAARGVLDWVWGLWRWGHGLGSWGFWGIAVGRLRVSAG